MRTIFCLLILASNSFAIELSSKKGGDGGGLSIGGTDGMVQYNNGGTALGGEANLTYDDTNDRLGVGTAVPGARLHVSSGGGVIVDGAQTIIKIGEIGTALFVSAQDGRVGMGTSSPGTRFHFSSGTFTVDGAQAVLRFGETGTGLYASAGSGRVGVGTVNPGGLLHLSSGTVILDGAQSVLRIGETGTALFVSASSGRAGIGTVNPGGLLHLSSGTVILDGAQSVLRVGEIGTALFVSASSGRVGVGTINPGTLLHFSSGILTLDGTGNAVVTASGTFNTTGAGIYAVTASTGIRIGGGGSLNLGTGSSIVFPDGTTQVSANAAGVAGSDSQVQYNNGGAFGGEANLSYDDTNDRLGVGTANPGTRLHVSSGSGVTVDGAQTVLKVGEVGTALNVSAQTGRTGINTVNPGTALHVTSATVTLDGQGARLAVGVLGTALHVNVDTGRVAVNDSSPDFQFEVESNVAETAAAVAVSSQNGTAMAVFTGAGRLGVGITNPNAGWTGTGGAIEIAGSEQTPVSAQAKEAMVVLSHTGSAAQGQGPVMKFVGPGMAADPYVFAYIQGALTNAPTNWGGHIRFGTTQGTSDDSASSVTERLRIDDGGRIAINKTDNSNSSLWINPRGKHSYGITISSQDGSGFYLTVSASNGRVGVGTSNAATRLHVSSGVLTLDGSGSGLVVSTASIGVDASTMTYQYSSFGNLDYDAVPAGACRHLSLTVRGCQDGDEAFYSAPALLANADDYQVFDVYVNSAPVNTVTLKRCNLTNATTALSDPAAAAVLLGCRGRR